MPLPERRRWARIAITVLAIAACAAIAFGGLRRLDIDTQASTFVPSDDPSVAGWVALQQSFGSDPIAVVLETEEPLALLGAAELESLIGLEGTLAGNPDVAVVYGPGTVLNQIAGRAQDLIIDITAQRDAIRQRAAEEAAAQGLSEEDTAAVVTQASAAFDERYGSLLVQALPAGLPTLRNRSFVEAIVLENAEIRPTFDWVMPDTTHGVVYVRPREGLDQAEVADLVDEVATAVDASSLSATAQVTGAPVVAAGLADEVESEAPRLAVASALIVALVFLVMGTGPWWRRLLPMVAGGAGSLVVLAVTGWAGVALSVGVLAFLPTILGVGTDFPIYAQTSSRRSVVVAAVAAATGFFSMAVSPMPFVRQYGILLGAGILATTAVALVITRPAATADPGPDRPDPARVDERDERRPAPLASGRARLVVAGLVALAVIGWISIPGIGVETRPQDLADGVDVLEEAEAAEAVLGASGEIAIRVTGDDVATPAVLAWFDEAEAAVVTELGNRLRPVVTPDRLFGFLGPEATDDEVQAGIQVIPGYLARSVITADQTEMIGTFGLRLGDLEAQRDLLERLDTLLPDAPEGTTVSVDGLPVVAARAVELTEGGRLLPSLVGIVGFSLVIAIGLRRRRPVALAVASAVVSTGITGLALAIVGRDLSPLSLSLGSLSVAVGGEFALVVSERIARGEPSPARPVVVAVATSVAGFAVLFASGLALLREFGAVLAGSVILAGICGTLLAWATTPSPILDAPEPIDQGVPG